MIATTLSLLANVEYQAAPLSPAPGWVVAVIFVFIILVGLAIRATYRRKKRDGEL